MATKVDETSIIAGINPVEALLNHNPRKLNHIAFLQGNNSPRLHDLQKKAKALDLRFHQLPKSKLDYWFKGKHQGVVAFCNERELDDWRQVKERIRISLAKGYAPHIVVPAAIEDPRNLGACIRSAVGFGSDVILYHNKGGCGLTPTAAKVAAGAVEQIPICQVGDIERELVELKEMGFTLIGIEASGEKEMHQAKYKGPLVLVVGGEDRGIPPHIARTLDVLLRIPIAPNAHSYNASVALSLLLYEANRFQDFQKLGAVSPFALASQSTRP